MAQDTALAKVIGKLMRNPSYVDNLWKGNRSGTCIAEVRTWDDFDDLYLVSDKYTLVLMVIIGKAERVSNEGTEGITWGRNCTKNKVPEINLYCSTIAYKSKWQESIERVKKGN